MVEWDLIRPSRRLSLDRAVTFDRLIERTVKELASKDTLVIFVADHSFDFRMRSGKRGKPLNLPANAAESAAAPAAKFDVVVGTMHTGGKCWSPPTDLAPIASKASSRIRNCST